MKKILLLIILFCFGFANAQDTLRIATWNTLKFPDVNAQNRIPGFRKVLNEMQPDVLVIQELTSESGVDYFKNDILNYYMPDTYSNAPYVDGNDTDNMMFYKKSRISLLSNRQIQSGLRDFSEYMFTLKTNSDAPKLRIYSLHLKASDDDRSRLLRKNEAEILRAELDQLPSDACFFVAGDFNLYTAQEEAYQVLIGEQENNNGRCYDPVDLMVAWHNNNSRSVTPYHTQSTRYSSVDDGAGGGMDDRFDFILVSKALMEPGDWYCIPESYQAFGNDGLHFNNNINGGTNQAVADSIADALYLASDHLPVCTDIVFNSTTGVSQNETALPQSFELSNAYPNPFNASTVFSYKVNSPGMVHADVYNVIGQHIETLKSEYHKPGTYTLHYTPKDLHSGVYFVKWQSGNESILQKILLIK